MARSICEDSRDGVAERIGDRRSTMMRRDHGPRRRGRRTERDGGVVGIHAQATSRDGQKTSKRVSG
jgi:hypothetical protein